MKYVDILIKNIGELITMAGPNAPRIKEQMNDIGNIHNAAIAIHHGSIVSVGPQDQVCREYDGIQTIQANGKLVTPGFVDPHTHPVFAGTRENEFEMRIAGATYQEIAKKGGGIRNSARKLQAIDKSTLREATRLRMLRFLHLGTTTIEAKSGYGLSTESEIKSLEVIQELSKELPLDIVPTFLGAHEIPDEYRQNRQAYIDLIINEMIPQVAGRKLAKYCDVFCEDHVFTIEESRQILSSAMKAGLSPKLHADELTYTGGAELAGQLHATSADHLMAVMDQGIQSLQQSGVIAVLLPATTFFLGLSRYAPARKMIESGVAVALATDFNPGSCMTQSMPMVLTISALYLKMTPAEALTASTINSACAIGMQNQVGSLMVGKQADLLLWQVPNLAYVPYHFGDNLIRMVIKRGKILIENSPHY